MISDIVTEKLTKDEAARYARRNAEIKAGIASLVTMAEALADVRDARLYREQYSSFEAYCRGEWGKGRQWGNSRAAAQTIIEMLSAIVDSDQLPVRESQTRALASRDIPNGFVADVWTLALNTTPNNDPKEVTAAHLRIVTEVINEAIVTEGHVDPGTGESEPVSPVAFKAAVLANTVERLSRQWEHMTRKRERVLSVTAGNVQIRPFFDGHSIAITLSHDTNLTELEAAIASGKSITVTMTTEKDAE